MAVVTSGENDDAAIFPLYVFPLSSGGIWISVVAVILLYLIQFDKNECHFSREENGKTTFLLFLLPRSLSPSRSYLVAWPSFLRFVIPREEETRKDSIFRCRRTWDLPTSLISLVPSIGSVNRVGANIESSVSVIYYKFLLYISCRALLTNWIFNVRFFPSLHALAVLYGCASDVPSCC